MADAKDRWCAGVAEREWLASSDLESFLAGWPPDLALNILGGGAHRLAQRLSARAPHLRVDAHPLRSPEDQVDRFHSDLPVLDPARLSGELTPRGSTVVLDPILGQWLIQNPSSLESLALKTFDRLLLPVFVVPAAWQLFFSDEFSFEEPVNDDLAAHRWCWCISDKPATVFIQSGEELSGHRLRFSLTSMSPGTFVCRIGDNLQAGAAKPDKLSVEFSFLLQEKRKLVALEIVFTGKPFVPADPDDQRKMLYFSFSGTTIEPLGYRLLPPEAVSAPKAVSFIPDRSVRRVLHAHGFFEVQTLGTPWMGLASLQGVRSCFDYRCGFSYRDTEPLESVPLRGIEVSHYGFPAIWYQARRMPTPGVEWTDRRERLSAVLAGQAGRQELSGSG